MRVARMKMAAPCGSGLVLVLLSNRRAQIGQTPATCPYSLRKREHRKCYRLGSSLRARSARCPMMIYLKHSMAYSVKAGH